jgi:hypothetical protein
MKENREHAIQVLREPSGLEYVLLEFRHAPVEDGEPAKVKSFLLRKSATDMTTTAMVIQMKEKISQEAFHSTLMETRMAMELPM